MAVASTKAASGDFLVEFALRLRAVDLAAGQRHRLEEPARNGTQASIRPDLPVRRSYACEVGQAASSKAMIFFFTAGGKSTNTKRLL